MKLILVESPTKARTLTRFLGKGYKIEATFGHIRDLAKGDLSVDVEHDFKPKYVIPRDKSKRVKELKALVKGDSKVILATDPDREGEAISYHMAVILSNKGARITSEKIDEDRFERITFHEITEEAIQDALKHPGKINFPLVDAQQARRILDRLVGYKLSPLLQKKLARNWLSAGRVQSISVRLIVEREREIKKFAAEEYWIVNSEFRIKNSEFIAKLVSKNGIKYEISETIKLFDGNYTFSKTSITTKLQVEQIIADLQSPFTVSAVDKKEIKRNPAPPFTTSALQIDAGRKLGFTAKRTMSAAQRLYEEGVITYHRTDSVNLSTKFLSAAQAYIEQTFGKSYSQYRTYATKSKLAQEAHEAIRPTDIQKTPQQMEMQLEGDQQRLYALIWKRAVASQMAAAIFDSTTIVINSKNAYTFQTQGSIVKFDGFLKVMGYDAETVVLPELAVGATVSLVKTSPEQKYTSPPPRYSEASLIKALEEDDIGRPSTYAPTMTTIQDRKYIEREMKEGKIGRNFVPTELGYLVIDFLVKYFPDIVDLPFTARMEDTLDSIAEGKRKWEPVIAEFYKPFAEKLAHVEQTVERVEKPQQKTGEKCPKCGQGDVVVKESKYGKFLGCNRYPECDWRGNFEQKLGIKCQQCKIGDIIVKKTRKGKLFYGCNRYPECNYATWDKPVMKAE